MGKLKFPPFRPDFCFGTARFSMPHVEDGERLGNRVVRNLLYYQTNYLVSYMMYFILISFYNPCGVFGGALMVLGCVPAWKVIAALSGSKEDKRTLQILFFTGVLAVVYYYGILKVFFSSVTLPIAGILLHAACRKRNLKNKLNWIAERSGLRTSIMAAILKELGTRQDLIMAETGEVTTK